MKLEVHPNIEPPCNNHVSGGFYSLYKVQKIHSGQALHWQDFVMLACLLATIHSKTGF